MYDTDKSKACVDHYYNNSEENFGNYLLLGADSLPLCFKACTIAQPRRANYLKEEMTASSLKEETNSFSTLLIFVISCYSFHLRHTIK